MKTDETLQENRQHSFLLIYILVLGLVVRIAAVMLGDFPLNDGGFFYSMGMDLLNNRFLLPVYTTYNQVSIPFAYPPFGLYLSALFLKIGIPITKTLQFLPALVSTVTIWAVYRLGFKMLNSRFQALLSAAVFASTPLAFIWRIFGGGITRSFGFLFLLLYLSALFSLFKNEGRRAGAVIWGSLTILSHPEAASNMVLAAIIFFLFLPDKKKMFQSLPILSLGIGLITSIWWVPVIYNHGINPFLSVIENTTGISGLRILLSYLGTAEALFLIFSLMGLLFCLFGRDYLLPVWTIAIFLLLPRGADQYAVIPLALAFAIFVDRILLPGFIQALNNQLEKSQKTLDLGLMDYLRNRYALIVLFVVVFSLFMVGYRNNLLSNYHSLSVSERQAMAWVKTNTPQTSRFLLLGPPDFTLSPFLEWFPALTLRTSILAIQGYEWLPGKLFAKHIAEYRSLQKCLNQGQACLQEWSSANDMDFDFIIVPVASTDSGMADDIYLILRKSLVPSGQFQIVYENESEQIFAKR